MSAVSAAVLTARCTAESDRWWRRTAPLRGSSDSCGEGKTYCHRHSVAAFGDFSAIAPGRCTPLTPSAQSVSCWAFTG
ncbi:hypothetical protein, partial [Salinibacter altiplanensis]|uniref:hypothetical protein n=1 Tax=Salinibacter altiplanensis TaxID=1803181 RepID=UPI001F3B2EA8